MINQNNSPEWKLVESLLSGLFNKLDRIIEITQFFLKLNPTFVILKHFIRQDEVSIETLMELTKESASNLRKKLSNLRKIEILEQNKQEYTDHLSKKYKGIIEEIFKE